MEKAKISSNFFRENRRIKWGSSYEEYYPTWGKEINLGIMFSILSSGLEAAKEVENNEANISIIEDLLNNLKEKIIQCKSWTDITYITYKNFNNSKDFEKWRTTEEAIELEKKGLVSLKPNPEDENILDLDVSYFDDDELVLDVCDPIMPPEYNFLFALKLALLEPERVNSFLLYQFTNIFNSDVFTFKGYIRMVLLRYDSVLDFFYNSNSILIKESLIDELELHLHSPNFKIKGKEEIDSVHRLQTKLRQQVYIFNFLFNELNLNDVSLSSKVRAIQFFTGKEIYGKSKISSSYTHKLLSNFYSLNTANAIKDLQVVKKYFDDLKLFEISSKVDIKIKEIEKQIKRKGKLH